MINLTDPRAVRMTCNVKNELTEEEWNFKHFIVVGFHEEGETALIAADLRDIANAIETLTEVYKTGMAIANPEVQRSVETDLFLQACKDKEEDND